MRGSRYRYIVPLIIFSMLLLTLLQALWLRSEYRSAENSFNRETSFLFRTTINNLRDSLIYSQFTILTDIDTLTHASQQIKLVNIKMNDTISVSNFQPWMIDSIINPYDMRFLFHTISDDFSKELLAQQYKKTLEANNRSIPFRIISKEIQWPSRSERMHFTLKDTIQFTTLYVPLGSKAYAARFEKIEMLLLGRLLPQIGISTFISLIILLSFIMVYKVLRSQQRLNEQKNDFIGNMTHELKTPVATVGVALEAIRNFDVLKDKKKAYLYLDMATQELNRLGMMTDKILQTSMFDYESDISSFKNPVDLKLLVEKVRASFRLLAERNKMAVLIEYDGDVTIVGNEEHLTQMIYNLIDNVFKYAPASPEVIVRLSGLSDQVLLEVIDHGEGIPEEHQKKVFEKFYRIPSGDVHTVKGYGLGLYYVKGVVESHGGDITLESQNGMGCHFIIKLPKHG